MSYTYTCLKGTVAKKQTKKKKPGKTKVWLFWAMLSNIISGLQGEIKMSQNWRCELI